MVYLPYQGSALPLSYGSNGRCFLDFRAFVNYRNCSLMQMRAEPSKNAQAAVHRHCTSLFACCSLWRLAMRDMFGNEVSVAEAKGDYIFDKPSGETGGV